MDFAEFQRALARRRGRRGCLVAARRPRSTHLLARRIVEEYGRESLVAPATELVAWSQSGGVGRQGRHWASPAGHGVYATLIRHLASAERIQSLPLAISAAVGETLDRLLGGGRCRLKWPNDFEVGGRKLGGILIDVLSPAAARGSSSRAEKQRPAALAVISLGVNFSRDLSALDAPDATSLEAERRPGDPELSLALVVAELIEAVDAELDRPPAGDLVARYERLSIHRPGDELLCRVGGEPVRGRFRGFDRHGFLRLDVDGEERRISSGTLGDG